VGCRIIGNGGRRTGHDIDAAKVAKSMKTAKQIILKSSLLGFALALAFLASAGCGSGQGVQTLKEQSGASTSNLGKVAYELNGVIYVKSLADAEVVRLTEGVNPRFSAGGDRVLFDRDGATWEINVDGSNETRLPAAEDDSGISPDGTRRVHVEVVTDATSVFGRYQRLHIVDLERGTDAVLYESRDAGVIPEGWTADGRYVLFWNDIQFSASLMVDGTDLMAVPAVGGELRALYRGLTRPGMVSPVPSGATLAVTEGVGRESWTGKRIALVDVDSGAVTELTSADRASLEPSWSPDGRRIAFVSQPDKKEGLLSGLIPELTRDRRIWVMNADGSDQRQLTNDSAYRDERPLWSADGSQILFARLDENMKASLWLMTSDGGEAKQVVDAFGPTAGVDYYGATDWDSLYDWWQPPTPLPPAPTSDPASTPVTSASPIVTFVNSNVELDPLMSGFEANDGVVTTEEGQILHASLSHVGLLWQFEPGERWTLTQGDGTPLMSGTVLGEAEQYESVYGFVRLDDGREVVYGLGDGDKQNWAIYQAVNVCDLLEGLLQIPSVYLNGGNFQEEAVLSATCDWREGVERQPCYDKMTGVVHGIAICIEDLGMRDGLQIVP
jgi:Tol biopolymer transport system component